MYFLQLLGLFLFASLKFLFAPALGASMGFNFLEVFITSAFGGIFGFFVFFYSGKMIIHPIELWIVKLLNRTPKKFTRQNRLMVRTKQRFGLIGIAFLSAFTSMPIAGLIVAKYYKHRRDVMAIMITAISGWSLIITSLVMWIKPIFSS